MEIGINLFRSAMKLHLSNFLEYGYVQEEGKLKLLQFSAAIYA